MPISIQPEPWTSEYAWHKPRSNAQEDDQVFTSTPRTTSATTLCTPSSVQQPVNNQYGDIHSPSLSSPSLEYMPMFATIQNDELSSLADFTNFIAQASVSQGDGTAEPGQLLNASAYSSGPEKYPSNSSNQADTSYQMAGQSSLTVQWQNDVPSGAEPRAAGKTKPERKSGGRKGRMKPEKAKKAHAMRKLHACFHCWARKVPVS